ncbi:hypothetical protein [Mycobacteroides abscessus]|uniref:hypothetical protein n=1 Tax=Mycobacteroides abscessus TaxID=36809 RepID=UPI0009A86F00|nr:hypothetical protein [Mycobacteroides abscessus]MDO3206614.1 hypothetical protein [Mycobacteroides abscessus subsp. massiliense]
MTAIQAVCAATVAVVSVAIGLVVAGVAVLAGPGWALVTAGVLLAFSSIGGAVVLLRDDGLKK